MWRKNPSSHLGWGREEKILTNIWILKKNPEDNQDCIIPDTKPQNNLRGVLEVVLAGKVVTSEVDGARKITWEIHTTCSSWVQNTGDSGFLLLMEEIPHQRIGSLSHYFTRFIHPNWLARFLPSTVFHGWYFSTLKWKKSTKGVASIFWTLSFVQQGLIVLKFAPLQPFGHFYILRHLPDCAFWKWKEFLEQTSARKKNHFSCNKLQLTGSVYKSTLLTTMVEKKYVMALMATSWNLICSQASLIMSKALERFPGIGVMP